MTDRHKTKPLSIRLPDAERQAVEAKAAAMGLPVRRVILDAIRAYLLPDGPGAQRAHEAAGR